MASASLPALRRYIIPRSLFGRSLLIVLLPLLILQAVVTVVFYERHWATVTRWLGAGLAGEVAMLVDMLDAASSEAEREAVLARARRHLDLVVTSEPGARLTPTRLRELPPLSRSDRELVQSFAGRLDRPFSLDLREQEDRRIAILVQYGDGLLRVLAPRKRVDSTTTNLLMLWMVGVSVLLLLIAIYFLGRQIRPIRRLALAADSFGKGRDIGDFKLEGALEIRRAGLAFNLMRERILRQMSQRTAMLAAISHDLRTPLTRMKLELELLASRGRPAQGAAGAIADLKADVEEMTRLVEAYLAFARGDGSEQAEPTELSELLQDLVERARRDGRWIELGHVEPIRLALRPLAIRRCLQNLIDNAGRYGRRIALSAEAQGDWVLIAIDDDGPGIAPDQREDVFRPFHRLDPSRHPSTGGLGLGLTIARDVALGHGGEIALDTSPWGGLRAVVRLPR